MERNAFTSANSYMSSTELEISNVPLILTVPSGYRYYYHKVPETLGDFFPSFEWLETVHKKVHMSL